MTKYLPVPPLRQSLDRYLSALRPLSEAGQLRRVEEVVAQFRATDGPRCQAELVAFAERENAAGESWLSREWLATYLAVRDPLPLTSSVGFRIRWDRDSEGFSRAAEVIHCAASVHLSYLRGELDDEVTSRGDPVDMRQWRVLAGGVRHPRPVEDVVIEGRRESASREIGVLWHGHCLMLPISDETGRPLPQEALATALAQLPRLRLVQDEDFTLLSYLGSDLAATHLDALMEHPGNAHSYERLVHALFLVNLTDVVASDEGHQERVTFHPGQAWAYKPLTYQVSVVDDFVALHVEHSVVDGATIRSVIALVQQARLTDGQQSRPEFEPLNWTMSEELRARIAEAGGPYRRRAEAHRVRILRCPFVLPDDLPFRVSHDAIQQLALVYAQLARYGQVRSTYEAVDVREYQAGRTECLRPVDLPAAALGRALLEDEATPEHLHAALAAHREKVIACKSGQGLDRHLTGLRLMAERLGLTPDLFREESHARLTTDFLSTSSLGDDRQMVRFAFAPTSVGGIGVNYTAVDDGYEYCLICDTDDGVDIDAFARSIGEGVDALARLVTTAARRHRRPDLEVDPHQRPD